MYKKDEINRKMGWICYQERWGNYKSDKYKTKRTLRSEIASLLIHGVYTKTDLIDIRDMIKMIAFGDMEE